MSQIIAYKSAAGIVLAADSRAVSIDMAGAVHDRNVNRLTRIGPDAAILSGGAAQGPEMAAAFKDFIATEGVSDIVEIHQAALPFLASEYERFMRAACGVQPIDPIHQVHFILGGKTRTDAADPYRLYFIWTKKKLPQLDSDEIGTVFSVPRLIRLEVQLNRQSSEEGAAPEAVFPVVRSAMARQAEAQEEVGGPLVYAVIDDGGFRMLDG